MRRLLLYAFQQLRKPSLTMLLKGVAGASSEQQLVFNDRLKTSGNQSIYHESSCQHALRVDCRMLDILNKVRVKILWTVA